MKPGGIRKNVYNITRIREILRVMLKYGFGYLIGQFRIERQLLGGRLFKPLVKAAVLDMPAPVRLRKAFEELGPTFIKFGQVLSMRPDVIPLEYTRELEKLQDDVPGFPYYVVEAEIERELGKPASVLFDGIAEVPRASASLAQVHEARLKTGESVIIKVQRPGIENSIDHDISILYQIASLAERYSKSARLIDPVGIVDEFRMTIKRELDFVNEAFNGDRFRRQFQDDPTVYIPRVFHEFTSRKVLTMERVEGIKISDTAGIDRAGLDRRLTAQHGAAALLKQIFVYGFFHADPHAGNILVGDNDVVILLDFGMVGRIHGQVKDLLLRGLMGIVNRDTPEVRDVFLSLGGGTGAVDTRSLDLDLEDFIDRYYGRPLRELDVGRVVSEVVAVMSRYGIRLPHDLFLLSKALIIIDGVGRKLDPAFNIIEQVRPFVEELQRQKYRPGAIARNVYRFARMLYRFTQTVPQDLIAVFNKMKRGTLKIEFEHKGLEHLTAEFDRSSNRIALSLIISALIIGSSIIVHANRGPHYFGLPLLGLAGFVVAGVMGLWLSVTILRSGQY